MKLRTKFIFTLIAIFILFLTWPNQMALTLTDGKTNKVVFTAPFEIGERFAIHFIHSIHKTPVYEEYYIDNELNIVLDKVVYESYGVGNPSSLEPGQTYKHENGKYIIGHINRKLPYFDQAIGQLVANHQLIVKGKWISLASLNPPGSWVRIQMKKVSFLTLWKG